MNYSGDVLSPVFFDIPSHSGYIWQNAPLKHQMYQMEVQQVVASSRLITDSLELIVK